MLDFNKYDDYMEMKGYDGFIDPDGYFYKVAPKNKTAQLDTHNKWADSFIREKLGVKNLKLNQTVSALYTLVTLNDPTNILINCYGYVYYSHDSIYYKPIIKLPNPKIASFKATKEQLDTLFMIMSLNSENTNIPLFFDDFDEFSYCGMDDNKTRKY